MESKSVASQAGVWGKTFQRRENICENLVNRLAKVRDINVLYLYDTNRKEEVIRNKTEEINQWSDAEWSYKIQ